MASLVLGAAGAVVGSFFGMPGLGFMIGSALGSALEPKKGQDGPRLTDLHNQNSQYGLMIPIAWGTVRIAGNAIWMPDKVEHEHHNSGKGGSGPSTYTYTQSMGIQICEGPIVGINRIWANKRLIWAAGVDSAFQFTLYTGTTTQLPHPAYEADKGVGNVPAHRGKALFFVDDMPLEDFGNTAPSFEFEVIRTANARIQRVNDWEPDVPSVGTGHGYLRGVSYDGAYIYISDYGSGSFIPPTFNKDKYTFDGIFIENVENHTYTSTNPGGDGAFEINPVTNSDVAALISHDPGNISIKTYWFKNGLQVSAELVGPPGSGGDTYIVNGDPISHGEAIYAIGGSPTYVAKWSSPLGVPNGIILAYYYLTDTLTQVPYGVDVAVANDGKVWCIGTGTGASPPIWIFDADLNLIANYISGSAGAIRYSSGYATFTVYNDYVCIRKGTTLELWHYSGGVFTLVDSYGDTDINAGGTLDLGGGYFLTNDGVFKILAPPTLQSVVDDLSVRAGYSVGQYLTDDLQQIVNGYVISQQSDCRSCLEPLLTWYFVDAVESGPAVKFVIRGAGPDENIPDDDLAAYIEGEDVPPLIEATRMQEVDLPRRVTVSYFDIDADYQIGSQHEQRETTYSTTEQAIAFALVASAKEAKQVAGIMMYDTWAKRRKISFSTPRKWSKLEPTDVKTGGGYTFVITKRDEGQAGVLKFDAVATRAQIFGAAAVGAPSIGFTPPSPPSAQATQFQMLDIPLIQDGDYPNGHYVAMAGATSPSWPGAELYKSIDGGTTYTLLQTNTVPDTIGTASSTLGNFLGGNVIDNINSFSVVIGSGGGTLASVTDLAMFNGANEFLLGGEVLHAASCVLTAPRTYLCSRLLRGRRGTDWAMSTHGASERFIKLPVSTNVNAPYAELGVSRKYKCVTFGQALASATAVDFTNTGVALKPYSPVHLGGGRNAAGDINVHWIRRTRIGGAWLDFVDSPLSEDAETYRVQLYTTSGYTTIAATLYVGTEQTDILASDQTTYFGGLQSTLYWDVAQLGSYGYGYAARGIT